MQLPPVIERSGRSRHAWRWRLMAACAALAFLACDISTHRLPVSGDYRLEDWDAGQSYRVVHGTDGGDLGGIFGGTVQALGWNASYLAARRHAMNPPNDDGIMLLHLKSGQVEGPLTDSQFVARQARDSLLAGLKLRPVREVAREL